VTVRYSRSAGQFIPAHRQLPPTRQGMICPLARGSAMRLDAAVSISRLHLACRPPVTHDRGCRGLHAADALFIGLGCVGGLALPRGWIHAGPASGVLILAAGGLYIAGALFYHRRWPDPYPSVFGYHEAFHIYVCAAAACQYAAIARLTG
jgi:hemolysin III-related protein